ncbi:N-acetyl-D-Glu racemase DgcA [Flexibacterium corallicola]|uniref:N-acetyl-D-Glu racemase DgcA n=1 Tax=Flexibacterium corallicola TaxID=3037259 RepID=UPI00286ECFA3|nr:N-acetyl-D-Glu racemase DgcA [Pseudovibrio sp. M1P-2-3]
MTLKLNVKPREFHIAGGFAIARGRRTHAHVVEVTLSEGPYRGYGECIPYPRYGESVEGVCASIQNMASKLSSGLGRLSLQELMPAGAARFALDAALWDLQAKQSGTSVASLLGLDPLKPVVTAFTISVGSPQKMGEDAAKAAHRPLLKVKLAGDDDGERIKAVRSAAPKSNLIVDANEAWCEQTLHENMRACQEAGVGLIEQPLPAGEDHILANIEHLVPICADESLHTSADLPMLKSRYSAVNIKLDKTGGLTEALKLMADAKSMGFTTMVGCMLGSSLAMAPAFMLAQKADYVDLDGPLLLSEDRANGFHFEGSLMHPPSPHLWG